MTLLFPAAWTLALEFQGASATFEIAPPNRVEVVAETYESLPIWNPNGWCFTKGFRLFGVRAMECSVAYALEQGSLRVETSEGRTLVEGTDYQFDSVWASIGLLEGGAATPDTPLLLSYAYRQQRIDTVVRLPDGSLSLVQGASDTVLPVPPKIEQGTPIANIYVDGRTSALSDENVFPIEANIASRDDEKPAPATVPKAAERLPKTYQKLLSGETVTILAWGDSVTETTYITNPEDRWQMQFLRRLEKRFPKAKITLVSVGWGGRTTTAFLNEPSGSPHNYQEKVLDAKPDLVVSEFINDSGLFKDQAAFEAQYGRILRDFQERGIEWAILTPHYSRCDWMGLTSQKHCDDDPRPYVAYLREFAKTHPVLLADAALRWGRLWREGIPHETLLVNNINHPNPQGLSFFADALMKEFE